MTDRNATSGLLVALLLSSSAALAQVPTAPAVAEVAVPNAPAPDPNAPPAAQEVASQANTQALAETRPQQFGDAVQSAASHWNEAVENKPKLVSLKATAGIGDVQTRTKERLKVLSSKTFSNREWRTYWSKQAETAGALAVALEADNSQHDKSRVAKLVEGL